MEYNKYIKFIWWRLINYGEEEKLMNQTKTIKQKWNEHHLMEAVIITWSERKVLKRVSLPRKILSNGAFATIRSREAQQFGRWTTRGRGSENIHNFMFTKIKIKRLCSRWSAWIAPLGSAGNSVPWWFVPPGQGVAAPAAATRSACLWQQPYFHTH